MSGEERLKQIDPGTGFTLEELIDAFISKPSEAKRLKAYLTKKERQRMASHNGNNQEN